MLQALGSALRLYNSMVRGYTFYSYILIYSIYPVLFHSVLFYYLRERERERDRKREKEGERDSYGGMKRERGREKKRKLREIERVR